MAVDSQGAQTPRLSVPAWLSRVRRSCRCAILLIAAGAVCAEAQAAPPKAVVTFQSIGLSWDPGLADKQCEVRYRALGSTVWRDAQPLWYDARDGEYRGSIVRLAPGKAYAVELTLREPGRGPMLATAALQATTWSEAFNVVETVRLPASSSVPLENFNDGLTGAAPDMGAHEAGAPRRGARRAGRTSGARHSRGSCTMLACPSRSHS